MDTIATIAMSFQHPLITAIGLFFDSVLIYTGILFAMIFINEKRRKILLSLLLAFLIGSLVKMWFEIDRPCFGNYACPDDYSFPSLHAATAFTLMIGFLNKKNFPIFVLFALIVSFTRMNLGVHTFYDIAGALPIALVSYYLTDLVWRKIK